MSRGRVTAFFTYCCVILLAVFLSRQTHLFGLHETVKLLQETVRFHGLRSWSQNGESISKNKPFNAGGVTKRNK